MGVEVHPVQYKKNRFDQTFNFWDCAGQEKYGGLQEGYCIGANGFIVMFDFTNNISWKNVPEYIRKIRIYHPTTPIIICGNKVDLTSYEHSIPLRVIRNFCNIKNCEYYDISAKSCYNYKNLLPIFVRIKFIFFNLIVIIYYFSNYMKHKISNKYPS